MLTLSIVLLILGAALLLLEVNVPGFGVCGVAGLMMIIASGVITVLKIPFGVYILVAELGATGVFCYYAFMYIKKRQLYGKLILDETLDYESKEIVDLDKFLGREGTASTSLRPFGRVSLNGTEIDAWSQVDYIAEGANVKVVAVEKEKVYVKKVERSN